MADMKELDRQFRLLPWLLPEHRGYVAGQYGSLLFTPEKAEEYIKEYEKKEKAADAAHGVQKTLLESAPVREGESPQVLPPPEKIDWDIRAMFAPKKKTKKVEKKVAKKVAVKKVTKKVTKKKKS